MMDSNYLDMLKCLNKAGVDYIMVGGWAVNLHGYVRAIVDLDIWILADPENARKVYAALGEFGAPLGNIKPKVFNAGPYTIYFWVGEGNPLGPVHVHVTEGTPSPNDTKFWITRSGGAILCHNKGDIGLRRLREIQSLVESQHRLIAEKWIAKFGEITYFCQGDGRGAAEIAAVGPGDGDEDMLLYQ